MAASVGPEPLLAPIARAHVAEHRSLFCGNYDVCLDRAAREGWASWSCAHCARFRAPHPACSRPPASPALRHPVPLARARSTSRAGHGPPASRDRVPVHSLDVENGTARIRLDAPSVPGLFVEAARAVGDVIAGRPLDPPAGWAEDVSIAAPDLEHLLIAWIRELAALSERSSVRFTEIDIVYLSERRLVASVRGLRLARLRNPLDAATCRNPSLVRCRDHVTAAPLLDLERAPAGSSPSDLGSAPSAPA